MHFKSPVGAATYILAHKGGFIKKNRSLAAKGLCHRTYGGELRLGKSLPRSTVSVVHIFSELYSVPEGIRKGCFKVKILELLLLLLSALDTDSNARSFTRSQVRPAEQVGAFIADKPPSAARINR